MLALLVMSSFTISDFPYDATISLAGFSTLLLTHHPVMEQNSNLTFLFNSLFNVNSINMLLLDNHDLDHSTYEMNRFFRLTEIERGRREREREEEREIV
jgi:hypothetical protein